MPKLTWISDQDLFKAVSDLLAVAGTAKTQAIQEFGKNVVDPFAALFEISGFEINYSEWVISERARQSQKTLQNSIGVFHQVILGSCAGWQNMGIGNSIDLLNQGKKIIAEVKNKHNTITGGQLSVYYEHLENLVMPNASVYKGYTVYYVAIIPKKPVRFDIEFTPSDRQTSSKKSKNGQIRHIDGASFYELVTGEQNALEELYDVLPSVIKVITGNDVQDIADLKTLFKKAYA